MKSWELFVSEQKIYFISLGLFVLVIFGVIVLVASDNQLVGNEINPSPSPTSLFLNGNGPVTSPEVAGVTTQSTHYGPELKTSPSLKPSPKPISSPSPFSSSLVPSPTPTPTQNTDVSNLSPTPSPSSTPSPSPANSPSPSPSASPSPGPTVSPSPSSSPSPIPTP